LPFRFFFLLFPFDFPILLNPLILTVLWLLFGGFGAYTPGLLGAALVVFVNLSIPGAGLPVAAVLAAFRAVPVSCRPVAAALYGGVACADVGGFPPPLWAYSG